MRLCSQDGLIDVPYEQVAVEIRDCDIWCGYYPTLSQHLVSKKFATYTTESKAIKAMEMVREQYQTYLSNNGGGALATVNFYVQPFAFNQPKVFKFPADDEIEV